MGGCSMKPLTCEWIDKAEGDFVTASREIRVRKSPNYDAVCFHAQQCAEKYLKALLQEAEIPFGKTHHLVALLELVLAVESSWELLRPQLQCLNTYPVSVRYPGEAANKPMAQEAPSLPKLVRVEARKKLGLDS